MTPGSTALHWPDTASWVTSSMMIICCSKGNKHSDRSRMMASFHLMLRELWSGNHTSELSHLEAGGPGYCTPISGSHRPSPGGALSSQVSWARWWRALAKDASPEKVTKAGRWHHGHQQPLLPPQSPLFSPHHLWGLTFPHTKSRHVLQFMIIHSTQCFSYIYCTFYYCLSHRGP